MTENTPMFIFMSPSGGQMQRMEAACQIGPKWFAYPIVQAGFDVHFRVPGQNYRSQLRHLIKDSSGPISVLVFTTGIEETLMALEYYKQVRICSLFQWIPLHRLPFHKRACYKAVLNASSVIAVYSTIAEEYVKSLYPDKPVIQIGLFGDTDFFTPSNGRTRSDNFVLCPGGNLRNENLLIKIAKRLYLPIIRFSNDPECRRYYEEHANHPIQFLYDVSYERMRLLYQQAACVLNVVDDSHIPAGIYAFCQALSMNCNIITPHGHSSGGYQFSDGTKPYYILKNMDDVDEWVNLVQRVLQRPRVWAPGKSPRDLARIFCSLDKSVQDWARIRVALTCR